MIERRKQRRTKYIATEVQGGRNKALAKDEEKSRIKTDRGRSLEM